MYKAYNAYTEGVDEGEEPKSFSDWRKQAELESPQFHFWSLTLYFQLTTLIFVQPLSEEHFQLYKNACQSLSPWYFFFRQHHYARWLSVRTREVECIETEIPAIAAEFKNSNFEVNKTSRAFSLLSVDQAHEQNNKIAKGDWGAIGLKESSTQLLRWMVSGPEMSGIINDFEVSQGWWFGRILWSWDQEFSPFIISVWEAQVKYQIRFVFVSQSRRMDQCEHKGHLLKLYYCNMLKPHPGDSETFQEYRETVFLPYIITQLRNVERMDVVWGTDVSPSALKILRGAREERIAVEAPDRTPGSLEIGQPPWGLTRTNRYFSLPVKLLTLIGTDHGEVVSTKHEKVFFNNGRTNAADLLPCVHEEAICRWRCKAWVHSCNGTHCRYGCFESSHCKIPIHFLIQALNWVWWWQIPEIVASARHVP